MIKKHIISIWILIGIIHPVSLFSNVTNQEIITPIFINNSITETFFKNPAELPLYDNLIGGKISYQINSSNLDGALICHIPDFSLGDIAISGEFFSSDLTSKILWIKENNEIVLSEGGARGAITWAKKTDFLTIGINAKYYSYRDTAITDSYKQGLGFDLGFYFTPFPDLFLGAYASDFSDTKLRNLQQQIIETIPQKIRLTASTISGKDMGVSIGIPISDLDEFKTNPNQAWKKFSFQGRKIFGDWLVVGGGYNTKDIFGQVEFKLSDFFRISLLAFNNVYQLDSNDNMFIPKQFSIMLSYGIPFGIFENRINVNENTESIPVWDYPVYLLRGTFDRNWGRRKQNEKISKIEEKYDKLEEKLDVESNRNTILIEIDKFEQQVKYKKDLLEKKREQLREPSISKQDAFEIELDIEQLEDDIRQDLRNIRKLKKEL